MVVLDTRYALHTVKYFEPPYQCVKDLRALAPGDDGARYQIFFHLLWLLITFLPYEFDSINTELTRIA